MDQDMAAAYTEKELNEIALWLKEGLSASRIAARFSVLRGSAVSRSAIIGIVHRNTGLRAIGFANPKGGRAGGRPKKNAARQNAARPARPGRPARSGTASQVPGQGAPFVDAAGSSLSSPVARARQFGQAKLPGQAELPGQAKLLPAKQPGQAKPPGKVKAPKPARALPPLWLRPDGDRQDSEIVRYKIPAPRPPAPLGRQPHVAAMRFVDCLFGRCRAPLDLALEEDPENDAPGASPGPQMLCCGVRTRATQSYCCYHHARFHGQRRGAA